jgi:TetR/AcrR family transcriptional regulator, transcriptional repressor for nem operon
MFREVYRSGFQSAGLDTILASAKVTKGALYHHFSDKRALGYVLVEEVIASITHEKWVQPLRSSEDPFATLIDIVKQTSLTPEDVRGGCPLNNLAQEMSPLDEGFRRRLAKVFQSWQMAIAAALRNGQMQGTVRREVEPVKAAGFLLATYEGYISLAKNSQDPQMLKVGIENIVAWLNSLRTLEQSHRLQRSHKNRLRKY